MGDLLCPASQFLAHAHRHCVHEMGTPGLHDIVGFLGLPPDDLPQVRERREQCLGNLQGGAHVNGGRNDVIAALAHVDVIIGMHLRAQALGREARNDLVGIHVGTGPRTGLEDINGELRIVPAVGYFQRRCLDRHRLAGLEQAELRIRTGSGPLDEAQGANEAPRHGQAADREVVHRTLRLSAPQGLLRHPQLAHAVALDAITLGSHQCSPDQCRGPLAALL